MGPNGQLLDAGQIKWHYSEDGDAPIVAAHTPITTEANEGNGQRRIITTRFKNSRDAILSVNNKGGLVKPRTCA
ncbi:hypothetical protein DXG01_003753 [Tephrocybe rancida]|nr:hypothetical protein DXG01_003753 [Tephrocybe rancida]